MFGLRTTVVFCWWIGIRCESICTQAQHDYVDPCWGSFTEYLGDGLCVVPGLCDDGDCIDCDACSVHVGGCTKCNAVSGCGWCAAISKCLSNEKLCEANLTTECDIPVPCTDEEWLAEPYPYSAFDYLCAQEVGDTIIENGDCFDCDLCMLAVGCAECTAKSGCSWCAASFSCTSNNSGCADAVAAECEDLTSLGGRVFNDPALPAQLWHLRAINVEPAWAAGFTGAGVNILFIDEPADIMHPDLVGKHVVNGSTTICRTQGFNGYHGLISATLAVAAANNSACGVGVAYDATFSQGWFEDTNERYTAGVDNGLVHVHSNSYAIDGCARYLQEEVVFNFPFADSCPFENSSQSSPCFSCPFDGSTYSMEEFVSCYSSIQSYCRFDGIYDVACTDHWDLFVECTRNALSSTDLIALQRGVTSGRGGKGIVYVVSAGNNNKFGERPNMDGLQNSIYTMSVAATDGTDTHAYYSERGPANFISAPGGEQSTGAFMVAARPGDACGFVGQGTSYSCPLVSGVAALMLEANPDLGWRDVQHIVAHTARKVDVDDSSWVTNGVGLSHSDKYGFGIVDAGAATQMAQAWTSANSTQWCVHSITVESNLAIPMEVEGTCSVIVAASEVQSLEHVIVYLNASHAYRGDLELRLTSPSGTESVLLASHNDDEEGFNMWKLMSVVYWGEVPLGTWQLSVLDKRDNGLDGNLSAFILAMYGKCAASASSTTYQDFDSECATSQMPSSAPTSAPSSAPSNAPSSAPTSATTTLATDGDDNDTTTTLATVSGSFVLTAESGTRAVLCQASNLAVGGRTYTAVEDAFNMSVVSLEDIVTLTLSCPETTLRRERRLQEESFEISFQAAFSDTSSADTFSSELTDASTASDLGSHFESLVSEIFNFSISATVAVTADDDNDGESSGVFGNGERVAAYFVLSVMGFFM